MNAAEIRAIPDVKISRRILSCDDGGPWYPVPALDATDGRTHDGGGSIRDHFAGQALAGDWAAQTESGYRFGEDMTPDDYGKRASEYYRMADAMISERKKQPAA